MLGRFSPYLILSAGQGDFLQDNCFDHQNIGCSGGIDVKITAILLIILAMATCAAADTDGKIRIYINTDMEGVTGIDSYEMIQRDGSRFEECRKLLMGDVNAAVEGAFAGGADEVWVLDGHSNGKSFIPGTLDKRAIQDPRELKGWWAGMNETFDGTFFVGAHAMAGTLNAFLDHTMNSTAWHHYRVNGKRYGEMGIWGTIAGHFGIPVLMVSGDEAACAEAKAFFGTIETAAVKKAVGRNKAECLPPDEARARIREAARKAVSLIGKAKPLVPPKHLAIELEYNRSDYCDSAAKKPGIERVDAYTIRKVTDDPLELLP